MKNPEKFQLEEILRTRSGTAHPESVVGSLSNYYDLVLKWNPRLHLTTVTDPLEFARRHLGEAEFAAGRILESIEEVWDLGTGLGIPGIPIAILRPDLRVKLVESNRAKAIFLEETISELELDKAEVIRGRIDSLAELPEAACATIRAVERMERVLVDVLRIGSRCKQILVFGNPEIESLLKSLAPGSGRIQSWLIPGSERRYLIQSIRFT
ncbi:MAG: class I SAM-dependent methyltransferase [Blastocatellia bacterium]|nr:class I SAM-dependent methyltransferase [Blastocatellia bacterium]